MCLIPVEWYAALAGSEVNITSTLLMEHLQIIILCYFTDTAKCPTLRIQLAVNVNEALLIFRIRLPPPFLTITI